MESVNFALLGDQDIAGKLGKIGTETDLAIYSKKEAGVIRTYVMPKSFPEKIQSLFQSIRMGEFAILYVTKLDKFVGEQIVALDILKKDTGILCHSVDVDKNTLDGMIKGTTVSKYTAVDLNKIHDTIVKIGQATHNGKTKVVIDHCFDVKGVGTVVLGKVMSGTIKQYDNLKLFPSGIDVMIKSIQMNDESVAVATSPARVGLALKGTRPEDIERGDILCEVGTVNVTDEILLDFTKISYYKKDISVGQTCIVGVGLKMVPGKIIATNVMKIKLERPIAYEMGDIGVMLKPESVDIRIAGGGKIKS